MMGQFYVYFSVEMGSQLKIWAAHPRRKFSKSPPRDTRPIQSKKKFIKPLHKDCSVNFFMIIATFAVFSLKKNYQETALKILKVI